MANTASNLPSPPPLLPHQIFNRQRAPAFYIDGGVVIDTLPPPPLPHHITADLPFDLDDLFQPHAATLLREAFARRLNPPAAAYPPDVLALPAQSEAEADVSDDDNDDEFFPPPAERDGRGLPEEVIARFLETTAARPEADGSEDHEACPVCLDELHREGGTIRVLGCRHRFHGECIGKWLRKKNDCPLCRATVVEML